MLPEMLNTEEELPTVLACMMGCAFKWWRVWWLKLAAPGFYLEMLRVFMAFPITFTTKALVALGISTTVWPFVPL
jgi:hypothetical protein